MRNVQPSLTQVCVCVLHSSLVSARLTQYIDNWPVVRVMNITLIIVRNVHVVMRLTQSTVK